MARCNEQQGQGPRLDPAHRAPRGLLPPGAPDDGQGDRDRAARCAHRPSPATIDAALRLLRWPLSPAARAAQFQHGRDRRHRRFQGPPPPQPSPPSPPPLLSPSLPPSPTLPSVGTRGRVSKAPFGPKIQNLGTFLEISHVVQIAVALHGCPVANCCLVLTRAICVTGVRHSSCLCSCWCLSRGGTHTVCR